MNTQASEESQGLGPDFNLESYRNLLERLQYSKRKQIELDKRAPIVSPQQTL